MEFLLQLPHQSLQFGDVAAELKTAFLIEDVLALISRRASRRISSFKTTAMFGISTAPAFCREDAQFFGQIAQVILTPRGRRPDDRRFLGGPEKSTQYYTPATT